MDLGISNIKLAMSSVFLVPYCSQMFCSFDQLWELHDTCRVLAQSLRYRYTRFFERQEVCGETRGMARRHDAWWLQYVETSRSPVPLECHWGNNDRSTDRLGWFYHKPENYFRMSLFPFSWSILPRDLLSALTSPILVDDGPFTVFHDVYVRHIVLQQAMVPYEGRVHWQLYYETFILTRLFFETEYICLNRASVATVIYGLALQSNVILSLFAILQCDLMPSSWSPSFKFLTAVHVFSIVDLVDDNLYTGWTIRL